LVGVCRDSSRACCSLQMTEADLFARSQGWTRGRLRSDTSRRFSNEVAMNKRRTYKLRSPIAFSFKNVVSPFRWPFTLESTDVLLPRRYLQLPYRSRVRATHSMGRWNVSRSRSWSASEVLSSGRLGGLLLLGHSVLISAIVCPACWGFLKTSWSWILSSPMENQSKTWSMRVRKGCRTVLYS